MLPRRKKIFHRAQLYDLLRGLIYICSLVALTRFGQLSRVYHYIRGEAMIKLYVIFNILEVRQARASSGYVVSTVAHVACGGLRVACGLWRGVVCTHGRGS